MIRKFLNLFFWRRSILLAVMVSNCLLILNEPAMSRFFFLLENLFRFATLLLFYCLTFRRCLKYRIRQIWNEKSWSPEVKMLLCLSLQLIIVSIPRWLYIINLWSKMFLL
jgi:hypothetical protein